jgi:molybdopterin adenylyltransferase
MNNLKILSVNISEKKGTIKHPVAAIRINEHGVEGDAHSGPWNRQVSLLGIESIRKFEAEANRKINHGEFAENITTSGIELWKTHPLDRLISDEVELEITQIGKECHGNSCAIFKEVGNCVMPKEGIFARTLKSGVLRRGSELSFVPKIYSAWVITLSDRASQGDYEDKSGPRLKELLEGFFESSGVKYTVTNLLIPDSEEQLRSLVRKSVTQSVDLFLTTGGTGIGPRDITPDVIRPMLQREIPGIMEQIRMKYGTDKAQALLSRSVAGVINKMLVYTLPGSVKAVNEYFSEISRTIMHSIFMLNRLDQH